MNLKSRIALCGAVAVVASAPAGAALAAGGGPAVTVRVEGLSRTLLGPTVVHTHSGSITKGGAPKGKCPASSAQGALDMATHHDWSGKWYGSYDEYEIFSILGQYESGTHYYWDIFLNNVATSTGACEVNLHAGDQVLFAAVPASGTDYPLAIEGPSSATVGRKFNVKVVWFNAKGKAKPLAGATVSVAGKSGKSNRSGIVSLTATHAGTFAIDAARAGYIRAAPLRVRVTA